MHNIWCNLNKLQDKIPRCQKGAPVNQVAITYGFSLLKELAFKFLTYVSDDVQESYMKKALLNEYAEILESLILSTTLFKQLMNTQNNDTDLFNQFFSASAKRMNIEMMLLVECVQN